MQLLKEFSRAILSCDVAAIEELEETYNEILLKKLLPHRCITFNGYLTMCKKLFKEHAELKEFYQMYYPVVIIDEFQDTNILSWNIVNKLISDKTELFFMGDSLQRIYGFIGAIPGLLDKAVDMYAMKKVLLEKNYRFRDNTNMLMLDKNIRSNAENPLVPNIFKNAIINLKILATQENESEWVVEYIKEKMELSHEDRIAILVQQRGDNIGMIINELGKNKIPYFYALFSDEDERYIQYHRKSAAIFFEELGKSRSKRINKTFLSKVYRHIENDFSTVRDKLIDSLLQLTRVFFDKITTEFIFLDNEDKVSYINDTFENRALKQNMDAINSKIFVSTVHGAKGLEWENVILPDMEQYVFPNYGGLCGDCNFKTGRIVVGDYCKINVENHNREKFIEELSVFYVAVTRARKNIVFSASNKRYNSDGDCKKSYVGCLVTIPGIEINQL